MKLRKLLLTAVSCGAVAAGSLAASAADVPAPALPRPHGNLDANGKPCMDGKLDGALQCIKNSVLNAGPDRPYRKADDAGQLQQMGTFLPKIGKTLVYAAVPGALVVFDSNPDSQNRFSFVRRITFQDAPAPLSLPLITAIEADPATNMVYISTRGHLLAIDLLTEKVVWNNDYGTLGICCERGAVTPDGKTLIIGSNLKNFHFVIDAKTGKVERRIAMPFSWGTHNMNLSADGKTDFGAPQGVTMTIADVVTGNTIKTITFDDHIRVFVINHDASKIYVNEDNLLGFEIADVASGKVVKRIEAPKEIWKAKWANPNLHFFGHGAPMHGIALTPDESEVWIPNAINNQVLVYDNNGAWPVLDMKKSMRTNGQPNGWITMGLDGKIALMASGDVADVKGHKIIAQLKDEYGRYMNSEKMLEMQFDSSGHLMRTVGQFAQGDPKAVAARLSSAKPGATAGN